MDVTRRLTVIHFLVIGGISGAACGLRKLTPTYTGCESHPPTMINGHLISYLSSDMGCWKKTSTQKYSYNTYTEQSHYDCVNILKNTPNRHPKAHVCGWVMRCLLCVRSLICGIAAHCFSVPNVAINWFPIFMYLDTAISLLLISHRSSFVYHNINFLKHFRFIF